eukprot:5890592-Amphidinium_carterae.1
MEHEVEDVKPDTGQAYKACVLLSLWVSKQPIVVVWTFLLTLGPHRVTRPARTPKHPNPKKWKKGAIEPNMLPPI